MQVFRISLALLLTVVFGSGCAMVNAPVNGYLFTNLENAVMATSNPISPTQKHGKASSASVMGLVAFGESSIAKAASRAGITKISHVDSSSYSLLGLYSSYSIHVYGE